MEPQFLSIRAGQGVLYGGILLIKILRKIPYTYHFYVAKSLIDKIVEALHNDRHFKQFKVESMLFASRGCGKLSTFFICRKAQYK